MSGLLRRLTRRAPPTADEPACEAGRRAERGAHAQATPPRAARPCPGRAAAATEVASRAPPPATRPTATTDRRRPATPPRPSRGPGRDLPAGVDLDELRDAPAGQRRRGKLRRRLRYLRRVRELLLRDLGGFSYEVHRTGGRGRPTRTRSCERQGPPARALDAEVRELEARARGPHAEHRPARARHRRHLPRVRRAVRQRRALLLALRRRR